MAKIQNQNNAKSLILVIITGIALAAATLCWFASANSGRIEDVETPVLGASSTAVFYQAIDTNRNGKIDGTESYAKIETSEISLENMVPGATYFYMVEFEECRKDSKFALTFENINDENGEAKAKFGDLITLSASLVCGSTTYTVDEALFSSKYSEVQQDSKTIVNCDVIKPGDVIAPENGKCNIYYQFKLSKNATIEHSAYGITIGNVYAAVVGG